MQQLSLRRSVAPLLLGAVVVSLPSALNAAPSRVETRLVDATGAVAPGATDAVELFSVDAAYSLAEVYSVGNRDFLILIAGGNGEFQVVPLSANGFVGADIQRGSLGGTGWRAVGVASDRGSPYIYLAKGADGRTLRYPIGTDGRVRLAHQQWSTGSALTGMSVMDVYTQSSRPRIFGVDTFKGHSLVKQLDPPYSPGGTQVLSAGWTDVDHVDVGGQVYRLMYKEAGEPYSSAGKSLTQEGRAVIYPIDGFGISMGTIYDAVLLAGSSSLSFVRVDDAIWGFMLYNRDGWTEVRAFDPVSTATTGTVMALSNTTPNLDEVRTYRRNGKTFMVGIEMDKSSAPAFRLSQNQMGRLAECVHDNLAHRAVGYQLSVAQGGRQILSRAHGHKQLTPNQIPMQRFTKSNIGSVGKLITTLTTLRMADDNEIALNGSVGSQIDLAKYPANEHAPWMALRTPYDMMAQISGHNRTDAPGCTANDDLTVDCKDFFAAEITETCNEGAAGAKCPRKYVNQHFNALRLIIEEARGITTSQELDTLTESLWLDHVVENGPSCMMEGGYRYFGACTHNGGCVSNGSEAFVQATPNTVNGWTRNCSAGSWQSSADDVVSILESLEGYGILSPSNTDLMLDTSATDLLGNATAVGFEPAYVSRTGGAAVLGKDGGEPMISAFATMLDGHGQAALTINTRVGVPDADELFKYAYEFAVGSAPSCTPLQTMPARAEVTTAHDAVEVAIDRIDASSRFVVAMRSSTGMVNVSTWSRVGYNVEEADIQPAIAGDMVEVVSTSQNRFVAMVRSSATGRLTLLSYVVDGTGDIALADIDEVLGDAADIAIAEVPGPSDADFVTAMRLNNNALRVIAWAVDPLTGDITKKGEDIDYSGVVEVSAASATTGRVIVATRTLAGKVAPVVYEISNNGMFVQRKGVAALADQPDGNSVRTTMVSLDNNAKYYVTAYLTPAGNLNQTAWTVSADGWTVDLGPVRTAGAITSLGSVPRSVNGPYYVLPLIDSDGKASPQGYRMETSDIELGAGPDAGAGVDVAVLFQYTIGRHWTTTAVATDDGKLRIVNYDSVVAAP